MRIKKAISLSLLGVLLIGLSSCNETTDLRSSYDSVDMLIGTADKGHTIVSANRPFAMVKPGPDTEKRRNFLQAKTITGFSQLHMSGTGGNAQSAVLGLMPVTGSLKVKERDYASSFYPGDTEARPGYFKVGLEDYQVDVEATSTDRGTLYRLVFSESDSARVLMDVSHAFNSYRGGEIRIIDNKTLAGTGKYNGYHGSDFDIAFYIRFSRPFLDNSGTWVGSHIEYGERSARSEKGEESLGAFLNFGTLQDDTLLAKVGISYVDVDGAKNNMETELPHWDFRGVYEESRRQWEDVLGKVAVKGGPEGHRTVFYTSLYHAMLSPSILSDVDGRYQGFDGNVHRAEGFTYYGEFSLWDTYRTAHPLYVLLQPGRQRDMIWSLLEVAEQGGWLPKWGWSEGYTGGMLGDHAVSLILDSYVKGIRDFDTEAAYRAMYKNATEKEVGVPWGRRGLHKYMKYGFAPEDAGYQKSKVADTHAYGPGGIRMRDYYPEISGSASATVEFSYNDWCVSQMAELLGHEKDAARFRERAYYYNNVYDPSVGFLRPRNSDGTWAMDPFLPTISGQHSQFYCEGNAWTYTWAVQHDVNGLIHLMGGDSVFTAKLDRAFDGLEKGESFYDPSNEPDIHYPYLFAYSGEPWKSQEIVRSIMTNFYSDNRVDGLPGDDDVGTMSAWYIFSAMGFYPVTPGTDQYVVGSPLFDEVTLYLDSTYYDGKVVRITSKNNGVDHPYVQEVALDGKPLQRPWITHQELVEEGELTFTMGSSPPDKHAFGTNVERPYSMTMSGHEPEIIVESLKAPSEAHANTRVDVEIMVTNTGAPGTKDIHLYLFDRNAHYRKGHLIVDDKIVLDSGQSRKLVYQVPLYFHRRNTLKIDSLSTDIQVHRPTMDQLKAQL